MWLSVIMLVIAGIATAVPSCGASLLVVAGILSGLNALLAFISLAGVIGAAGAFALMIGKETELTQSVRAVQGGLESWPNEMRNLFDLHINMCYIDNIDDLNRP